MKWTFAFFLFCQALVWGDTLTLNNDSNVQLSANVLDATGALLGEMMIETQDTMTWSLNYEYFGYESQPSTPQTPYTVNWYCPSGQLFGTCHDVPSDSVVSAMSCAGPDQCQEGE